jgi:hypothetical protein
LSLGSCERGSHACSKDADDEDARRMNSWLRDTSDDEVYGILERAMQGYNDAIWSFLGEK